MACLKELGMRAELDGLPVSRMERCFGAKTFVLVAALLAPSHLVDGAKDYRVSQRWQACLACH